MEGNYQRYRDRENLLICEKGARERLSSRKTFSFEGTSVLNRRVEFKDIALGTSGKATGDSAELQPPGTFTPPGKTDPTVLLRNRETYNQPQGGDVTVAGFVPSHFKAVTQMSFLWRNMFLINRLTSWFATRLIIKTSPPGPNLSTRKKAGKSVRANAGRQNTNPWGIIF